MAEASRQKRGAVPTSRSAGEFGIEFVALFPALGPRIEPSALVGTPKVAIDQLRLPLRRIGIWSWLCKLREIRTTASLFRWLTDAEGLKRWFPVIESLRSTQ